MPFALWFSRLGEGGYMVATAIAIIFAVVVAQLYERQHGGHDSKEVVIDEIVGYMVAYVMLPPHWSSLVTAFVAFRFFDILKPWPISWLDRKVKGGLGVVIDDVAAGLCANLVLQVTYQYALPRLLRAIRQYRR